jgi:nicotinamidase-related amidase
MLNRLNTTLIASLQQADKVVICGEAVSHCVNYTVRDLVAAWPEARRRDLILLTDCASPVPGFEAAGEVWAPSLHTILSERGARGLIVIFGVRL